LFISFTIVQDADAAALKSDFLDVAREHWGYDAIKWAADSGIINGDGKGNFLPDIKVNEKEFVAMLMRAYSNDFEVAKPKKTEQWYEPYFRLAEKYDWPVYRSESYYSRGHVADLLAATAGKFLNTADSIQFLLDKGLAKGKTSNTIAGYKANDSLTRAEAVTFIYRFKQAIPSLIGYQDNGLQLFGIHLGDTEEAVREKLGSPARQDGSEDGFTWYIYNEKYDKYAQVGIHNNRVVALYSNAAGAWSSNDIMVSGMAKAQVAKIVNKKMGLNELFIEYERYVEKILFFDANDAEKLDAI